MPSLASLDAAARSVLESELRSLDGIVYATIDAETGDLWVIREPDAEPVPLELAVRGRLGELGHDAEGLPVSVAVTLKPEPRRRVRFVDVVRTPEPSGVVRVAASVEWDGHEHRGEATGEKGWAIELKTTGRAVVQALETLADQEFGLRVIGIKQIHAFDSEVVVASLLQRTDEGPRKLVGAAVVDDDPLRAAAIAVLDALNRTLGNFLSTKD